MSRWQPVEQMQDLVNKLGGGEGIAKIQSGELVVVPRNPGALFRPLGDPIDLPAVPRFVAEDACTETNGIAWMHETFMEVMLPLVEEDVPPTTLFVQELTSESRILRIAAALDVDGKYFVSLAHFLRLLSTQAKGQSGPFRTDKINSAIILGNDDNIWAVDAVLYPIGWHLYAYSMGYRKWWTAGTRFLSR